MMQERETQLEQLGKTLLSYSKRELYLSMRFLGTALEALPVQMRKDIRGLGTEGETLYFHTPVLVGLYEENPVLLNRACLHLLLHCLFYHPFRMQTGRKKPDAELWDIACDIAVESVLDELPSRCVAKLVSDERRECCERLREQCPVLTAEGIYYRLERAALSFEQRQRLIKEFHVDDHALWEAKQKKENKEQNGKQGEEPPPKWKRVSEAVKAELEVYLRKAGTETGTLTEVLKLENRKKQDLGEFLRKFAVTHEEVVCDEDSFDLNFYTYGLRLYGNLPLVEPLEYKEVSKIEEMVMVIDTSGSCSGTAVKNFLEQAYAILKEKNSFFQKFILHIIQADVRVVSDTVITSEDEFRGLMEHFEVRGFGGTDFRPAFDYVEQLRNKGELTALKGLLYFTDGIGTYPKKRPDYKTVFVFLKKLGEIRELPVPVWAERLVLEEQDYEY
ncbi:MAG: VWA-like domain-containing protein [Lachnospiraceae bacterium]